MKKTTGKIITGLLLTSASVCIFYWGLYYLITLNCFLIGGILSIITYIIFVKWYKINKVLIEKYFYIPFLIISVICFLFSSFKVENVLKFSYRKGYFLEKLLNFDFNIVIFLGILFFVVLMIIARSTNKKDREQNKNKNSGFLISDKPIEDKDNDELGMEEKATTFAVALKNNGSNNNFIYGIIAPWGYGKTTFLHFVKEKIEKENIIFDFNPWQFDVNADIYKKFLEEFRIILEEKSNEYLPELDNSFDNLINILSEVSKKQFGFSFDFFQNHESLEQIKGNINGILQKIDKKIFIIIDDLDRLPKSDLVRILRLINLCRDFYNTNFIICYDTNNLNCIDETFKINTTKKEILQDGNIRNLNEIQTENIDSTKISEYFEKIVNVSFNLLPDYEKLCEYMINLFTMNNLGFTEESKKGIVNGVKKLFNNENTDIWGKYFLNIRGIKRIYNNLLVSRNLSVEGKQYLGKKMFPEIFDEKFGLLKFDILVKLSILSLSFPDLYTDIHKECGLENIELQNLKNVKLSDIEKKIVNEMLYFDSKNKFKYIYNYDGGNPKWKISPRLEKYLNLLSSAKGILLSNIFLRKDDFYADLEIEHINKNLNLYIGIIENDKEIEQRIYDTKLNNYINDFIDEFFKGKKNLEQVIEKILEGEYKDDGIEKFCCNMLNDHIHSYTNKLNKIKKFKEYVQDGLKVFGKIFLNNTDYSIKYFWYSIEEVSRKYDDNNEFKKFLVGEDKKTGELQKMLLEYGWGKLEWLFIVICLYIADEDWKSTKEKFDKLGAKKVIFNLFNKYFIEKNFNLFTEINNNFNEDIKSVLFFLHLLNIIAENQDNKIKLNKYYVKCFQEDITDLFDVLLKEFVNYIGQTSISLRNNLDELLENNDIEGIVENYKKSLIDIFDMDKIKDFVEGQRKKQIENFIKENGKKLCIDLIKSDKDYYKENLGELRLDFFWKLFEKTLIYEGRGVE